MKHRKLLALLSSDPYTAQGQVEGTYITQDERGHVICNFEGIVDSESTFTGDSLRDNVRGYECLSTGEKPCIS